MDINKVDNVYFLGIGGIGMSALARYFKHLGKIVAGYDRTPTGLTQQLIKEGIDIHFEDHVGLIDEIYQDKNNTLVVFTPAIPDGHNELKFFVSGGFHIMKRARALGAISGSKKCIAVAGTHGKTTITTMVTWLLKNSHVDCSAFLGGISKNFDTNFLYSEKSGYVAVEADEYDRSFLHLKPHIAIVTAIDADHLEIYGNRSKIIESFNNFANLIDDNGALILHSKLQGQIKVREGLKVFTYSLDGPGADYYAKNIMLENGLYSFTLVGPGIEINNLSLGVPGLVNLENAVAACAAVIAAGAGQDEVKAALPQFQGVRRRFDILLKTEKHVYIDDYAHHPEEIKRFVESVRELFPSRKITGIFQPHLYSRTKDFADEFAASLSLLDKLYLLEIYPARELPIEGVTPQLIFDKVTAPERVMCSKNNVVGILARDWTDIVLTMGAGDIDSLTVSITQMLKEKK